MPLAVLHRILFLLCDTKLISHFVHDMAKNLIFLLINTLCDINLFSDMKNDYDALWYAAVLVKKMKLLVLQFILSSWLHMENTRRK